MEVCYIVLNSALVLKAVPLFTREKNPLYPGYIKQRIVFKILVTTYKALNGLASGYITDLLDRCPWRSLRSSNQLFTERSR